MAPMHSCGGRWSGKTCCSCSACTLSLTRLSICVALQMGILDKYNCELIGAKLPSIDKAEDRELFKQAMVKIGLKTPTSGTATSFQEALKV